MRSLAREYPVHYVVLLFLLSLVVYGTFREVTAHARQPNASIATPTGRALSRAAERQTFHEAEADADLGPGEAEPVLAQHPGR